jgi:hypothetical protein
MQRASHVRWPLGVIKLANIRATLDDQPPHQRTDGAGYCSSVRVTRAGHKLI